MLAILESGSASTAQGLIAFARADGVYVMRPDGTGLHALRRGRVASRALELDWSNDGTRLAFEANGAIWVMRADGTNLRRIVAPAAIQGRAHSPSWSSDDERVAFARHTGEKGTAGGREIWVVDATGGDPHRLARLSSTGLPSYCAVKNLDWSPDGRRFALTIWCGYVAWVSVANTNGTELHRLTTDVGFPWANSPHWSPNSRRVVFEEWLAGSAGSGEIVVKAVDGGSRIRVTRNGETDNMPVWSPDGRKIAFVHGSGELFTPGGGEICVMNADGTGVRCPTDGGWSPAWQPVAAPS